MKIKMMDGAGGEAMEELIREILSILSLKTAGAVGLDALDDGATVDMEGQPVFTIDAHTVKPLFFPGGDIGRLAVSGTVNDLAMMGAEPKALALSLIIQDGFERESLNEIIRSIDSTSREVPVPVVTGDTKVVEDKIGMFAITAGVGSATHIVRDSGAKVGDAILLNGGIGEHGFAILSRREGIEFETTLKSDVAPVWDVVKSVADEIGWENIHAMKDPTRGGLSEVLNEMASKANVGMELVEENVPMRPEVRAASEMLGISPFMVANEGKVVMIVPEEYAENAVEAMKRTAHGANAAIIGKVIDSYPGRVLLRTEIGGRRFLERPLGDPVPRVC
ncbi:MAG: hydrogenase expression/formation protein HypE [Euryarchaeota archaeon]|nr:hydrogenase expression/formation protein HypE [Euryarchaeota archaeon]